MIDPPTAYQDGQRFNFLAVAASTGATTLKVNGLAALPIRRRAAAPPWRPPTSLPPARAGGRDGRRRRHHRAHQQRGAGGRPAALCCKAAANSFTEPQTVEKAATGDPLTIRSTDAGAAAMGIKLDRNSASPAAADSPGDVQIAGRDDAATARVFSILRGILPTPPPPRPRASSRILQLLAGS